jgi:hypothetical protein
MSLKDLPDIIAKYDFPPSGTKITPSDYGRFTLAELDFIYRVAKERVKLHSPIFQTLVLEWEVDARLMMLMLTLSARVRNRDDMTSISDNERREVRRMVESDLIGRSASIVALAYDRPTPTNRVTISTKEAVHIPYGLQKDEDALVVFLGAHARERLRRFVYHEVDEMLLVDNERRFDPHPKLSLEYTFRANGDVETKDLTKSECIGTVGGFTKPIKGIR